MLPLAAGIYSDTIPLGEGGQSPHRQPGWSELSHHTLHPHVGPLWPGDNRLTTAHLASFASGGRVTGAIGRDTKSGKRPYFVI